MELSLTGEFLERLKDALESVVYDHEEEGGEFFLEFDGYSLKLYSKDWTYLDIDETEMDFADLKPFMKKIKAEYLKEFLDELKYIEKYGEAVITVGDDIVYMYLIDHYRPSAYNQNIAYSYYIK
jgi:hypothetical protein